MINDINLVSFYTDKYEKYVENFTNNAKKLSCKTYIEKKGEWKPKGAEKIKNQHHSNCKWKPSVIKSALSKNEICLWLDIDCHIEKINYVPEKFDVGYFTNVPKRYSNKISVGWIWFNNTPNTFNFLDEWERNQYMLKPSQRATIDIKKARLKKAEALVEKMTKKIDEHWPFVCPGWDAYKRTDRKRCSCC